MRELIKKIIDWEGDRGIFNRSNIENQKLNLIIEAGELCSAVINKDRNLIKKGIGGCIYYSVVLYSMSSYFNEHNIGVGFSKISLRGFRFDACDFSEALSCATFEYLSPIRRFKRLFGILYGLAVSHGLSLEECVKYICELFDNNKCGVVS
ncbi:MULTISPECIES: hypothetical protein [Actinobacillus]|uniref:Uncharacterized protein n=1 Tax=Actinobacillus lignieresii TaxID=720 RepID=A0A380TUU7_ACTLI|nr:MULTISPECIES: hypothetical protein [Actinobacillus]WGE76057.1 hypothetical protein NYR81_03695 [Actinobacillus equuli subsp. haemolyticus]WGE78073.1 hypothetical protein NYR82_04335 [Actinobacillus equuli subsp. haemolyticus]SSX60343.1 Uncharacterised protein [Actinobacillus lignieresii]SUT91440.1 Uncharacterised protein [Actinobacillus lignieresii]